MADTVYRNEDIVRPRQRTDWGAIWAGMFTFMAIWAVFGSLGAAIFASAANPNAAQPVAGMGWGISIWSIVLTIIAMYVAGRETGRLAGVTNRHDALLHAMTMFGLSVVAAVIIVVIAGEAMSGNTGINGSVHSAYVLNIFTSLGWAGFVSLFLGWLAAMLGASSTVKAAETRNVREIRPAA